MERPNIKTKIIDQGSSICFKCREALEFEPGFCVLADLRFCLKCGIKTLIEEKRIARIFYWLSLCVAGGILWLSHLTVNTN